MNKLIDELSQKAEDYADEYWLAGDRSWLATYTEKFAELLLSECVNLVSEQSAYKPEYRIRKHFGVE